MKHFYAIQHTPTRTKVAHRFNSEHSRDLFTHDHCDTTPADRDHGLIRQQYNWMARNNAPASWAFQDHN